MAWKQEDCPAAISWLSTNGFAILGTELWLIRGGMIRTAISTKAGPALYVSSCDPVKGESWQDYAKRSARETIDLISAFCWPEDALEPARTPYFRLCWADLEWFRTHCPNAKYFANE